MASADFSFALTKELSPGKVLFLSLPTVRLYLARLGWTWGFTVASKLTARTRPLCRFVFLRSKVCSPLPSAWPRGLRPTTSTLRFPTVTSIGPGEYVATHKKQPMLGTLAQVPRPAVSVLLPTLGFSSRGGWPSPKHRQECRCGRRGRPRHNSELIALVEMGRVNQAAAGAVVDDVLRDAGLAVAGAVGPQRRRGILTVVA